jgi:membrane associated rhomboid family serine protease
MTLSLPPFTRAVTWLIGINTAIFLLMELFELARLPIGGYVGFYGMLRPFDVVQHGWIWQILTYSFLHAGFTHWLFNMIALWMFGARPRTRGDAVFRNTLSA